ncbi:hypothetical protein H9L39_08905 [Fusarium oxysporum f. sp. albedinis]|nr:hypothetical protein H9L39_08905 [Fusarium oxysporum f. sp. albedinis]
MVLFKQRHIIYSLFSNGSTKLPNSGLFMRSSRNKSLGRCKRLKGSLLGVMRGTIGGISAPEAMISSKTQKLKQRKGPCRAAIQTEAWSA